jgi:hypothetical protein
MAIALGYLKVYKARSEKKCDLCKEQITAAKWYILSAGRSRGSWFSHKYHLECYPQYILDKVRERQKNPKSSKPLTSRLQNLTPEQVRRRETLQTYLSSKDKVRLLKAYRSGDFNKIKHAYSLIAARWAELHQMGVPFRTTIVPQSNPKLRSEEDKELVGLILNNDYDWYDKFQAAKTVEEKMLLLFREPPAESIDPFANMTEEELEAQRIAREEYDRERIARAEESRARLIASISTSNLNEETYIEQ